MLPLVLFFALTFSAPTDAEITLPTPPKPPELPRVEGSFSGATGGQAQSDAFTLAIVRLDSLKTLESELKGRLAQIKKKQTETRKGLDPATRLKRIYLQTEVDRKAYPIRRTLPTLSGKGDITVRFIVNPEGRPEDIEVVSPIGVLGDDVRRTVSTWLYGPARKSARRVPVRITVSSKMDED